MKKIKILYGLEAADGGSLKHLSYLVCNLDKSLLDITVVVSPLRSLCKLNKEIEKMKSCGVNVVVLPMKRNISIFHDLVAFVRILKLLTGKRYDIVHAHSSKAGVLFRVAAWWKNVPTVIYTPHCFYFQSALSQVSKYFFLMIEILLSCMTDYIIVSDNEKKAISQYGIIPKRKILCINNAIKFVEYIDNVDVLNIKKQLNISPSHIVVGGVGRLERQKDWETFLRVAEIVINSRPHTTFLIVGDGSESNSICQFIESRGLSRNIIITGYVTEIERVYSLLDIFVSTSLWEGLPYVFLEAMRYKKPIVTTDHGSDKVVINNKTGIVKPCKDFQSIACSIIRLIDDKERIVQLGLNGYHHLHENFHFNVFIQKHHSLYHSKAHSVFAGDSTALSLPSKDQNELSTSEVIGC